MRAELSRNFCKHDADEAILKHITNLKFCDMLTNQKNPGRKPLISSSLKEQRLDAGAGMKRTGMRLTH